MLMSATVDTLELITGMLQQCSIHTQFHAGDQETIFIEYPRGVRQTQDTALLVAIC
jgi:hypothetical protein